MNRLIRNVEFNADGVAIQYATPAEDIRENGLLLSHILLIPASEGYAQRLDDLLDQLQELLNAALHDFVITPPAPDDDVEDDGPSPWDNPLDTDAPAPPSIGQDI